MTGLLMIAKGFVVVTVTLASMVGVIVGMVALLYGRAALSGDRYYAQEVTMSVAAGGLLFVTACVIAAFVVFPPFAR